MIIYLTNSDEEAFVEFVKDHEKLYRPVNTLRTRPGRNTFEGVQDLVRIPTDSIQKADPFQVWPGYEGNDSEAELNSG